MLKLFLFTLSITLFFSQEFTIKAGLGMGFHIEDHELKHVNRTNAIEDIRVNPTIGQYYDSNHFYEYTGILHFIKDDPSLETGHFLLGLSYFSQRDNLKEEEPFIYGKKLRIISFAPFLGYARYFENGNNEAYYYLNLGLGITTYSGSEGLDGDYLSTKYKQSTGLYVSAGLYHQIVNNFGIDVSLDLKYNQTVPEEAKMNARDGKFTIILDEDELEDIMIRIKFSIGYTF